MKVGLLLMKYVLKPLAKSVLIPLRSTAAAATEKKKLDSRTTSWTISIEEMESNMKIVKPFNK